MMLPENIQALRRKNGLSQEQLAMRLGVSRQAVSKWETGAATPELDKLLALGECFQVSLDILTGGPPESLPAPGEMPGRSQPSPSRAHRLSRRAGIGLCLAGGGGLALGGILFLLQPAAIDRLNDSSALTLRGSGMLCLICLICLGAGLGCLLRKK